MKPQGFTGVRREDHKEGVSPCFLDPGGHRLGFHASDLASRLAAGDEVLPRGSLKVCLVCLALRLPAVGAGCKRQVEPRLAAAQAQPE